MKKTSLVLIIFLSVLYIPSSFGDKTTKGWRYIIASNITGYAPWSSFPHETTGLPSNLYRLDSVTFWSGLYSRNTPSEGAVRFVTVQIHNQSYPYFSASPYPGLPGLKQVPVKNCDWFSNSDGNPVNPPFIKLVKNRDLLFTG